MKRFVMVVIIVVTHEYFINRVKIVAFASVSSDSSSLLQSNLSNERKEFEKDKIVLFNDPRKILPYPRVLTYTLNRHMEELCPEALNHCWCGMLEDGDHGFRTTFNPSFPRDLTLLCNKRPYIIKLEYDPQDTGLISKHQVELVEKQLENLPTEKNSSVEPNQYYNHNDSFCEPQFKWC